VRGRSSGRGAEARAPASGTVRRSSPAAPAGRAARILDGGGGAARLEALVGNTPLIELPAWGPPGVALLGKAEHLNPGGSVKDRAALRIVRDAEAAGALLPGKVLLDASSGNTGIAYAMLGAARGYRVEICLPRNASPERKHLLRAYGAAVVETDPLEGAEGAVREARHRAALDPERYYYADQYNNDSNWRAHYDTTGPEVWRQTAGRITHWVAGLGTTGTFTGTARRLRELSPAVRCVAVQPDAPFHGLEGMKHLASSTVPGIYDPGLTDEVEQVRTEEAQAVVRRLAREAGILVGVSAGANVAAAVRVALRLERGVVVTVLCDGGDRYLSHAFWKEG
jgi:cysteine synthase B